MLGGGVALIAPPFSTSKKVRERRCRSNPSLASATRRPLQRSRGQTLVYQIGSGCQRLLHHDSQARRFEALRGWLLRATRDGIGVLAGGVSCRMSIVSRAAVAGLGVLEHLAIARLSCRTPPGTGARSSDGCPRACSLVVVPEPASAPCQERLAGRPSGPIALQGGDQALLRLGQSTWINA